MDQYKRPKCGSDNLKVVVQVWARLIQEPEEDNIQTEFEGGDMEFDDNSPIMSNACGEHGAVKCFLVRPDLGVSEATLKFILAQIKLGRPVGRDLNPGTMAALIEHDLTEGAFEQLTGSRDMVKAKEELERLGERLGREHDLTYLADLEVPNG